MMSHRSAFFNAAAFEFTYIAPHDSSLATSARLQAITLGLYLGLSRHAPLQSPVTKFHLKIPVSSSYAPFAAAQVELTPIWNYNPSVFFEIPHFGVTTPEESVIAPRTWLEGALQQCCTPLKSHQLEALDFLRKNECLGSEADALESPERKYQGSILADDMGLRKTLTTLAYVLVTRDSAVEFQWADWEERSAATLVVCPLATMSNWEHKSKIHFKETAIMYQVFHGPQRKKLSRQELQSPLVVLTTYEMISGIGSNDQHTIGSLDLNWFRIVLDEAHLIRNPNSTRAQSILKLQAHFVLLLTGTPVQNRLTDLQSLIAMIKIAPWDQELIHLIVSLKTFLEGARGIKHPKAVVFSSFVGFLEIIERPLEDNHIRSTWLTGDCSTQKRDNNLACFRSDKECNVLLASLQAAGVGIDLRCAQNVYLMEPSWNPASEFQAID
ncbi:hypothetical protein PTTG_29937 [Puccinia triticina 1-1 BBBD Race 1]|uniref:Helicase ATP-binding domain-containing protein n=1 Tax=Puccinia triticina (isolate 1-1 / race 1 (BBBD)) TaxID=630390 RepID=A0A180G160_PUCT1|nr:hypothetical protein PTTG_29937 [Puccinia triticina 1-1 BBBD Race 1]